MAKDSKLRLPTAEDSSSSKPEKQQGRYLTEVNGVPVWVDSEKTLQPSENTADKTAQELSSEVKRLLGISG